MANPDLVLVEQAIRNLETYPLLARKAVGGPSVAMWGHGRSYSTPQGPTLAAAKQFLTRRCDWFFAYTQAGAVHVIDHGFPATRVSVLNNTIDTDELQRDLESVSDADIDRFRREYGLTPGRTALFLGGIDQAKGIDFLLESALAAGEQLPGFVLLVGGAGAQLEDVKAAQRSGAPVRALGRLDGVAKALVLRATDVLAIPQWIGLVAVDSLVSGRPIVSTWHNAHSPEQEYLEPGISAVFTDHDVVAYSHGLTQALTSLDLVTMQGACLAAAPHLSLDHMVDAFVEGVVAWDHVRRSGL
jgi:glycosyltransferase involved in cell wall biosynthesis